MSDKKIEDQLVELTQQLFVQENGLHTAKQLVARFQASADNHRQDQTIQQVARVIELMASRQPNKTVTAQDLHSLSQKFWSSNTNFNEEFQDLLTSSTPVVSQKQANRHNYYGDVRTASEVVNTIAEVDLYDNEENIDQLVDPNLIYAKRDTPLFRYAAILVNEELEATNKVAKPVLKLKYQTPETLLYQATFKIASGEASVYIPVEVRNGSPLIPQVMTTNDKVYSLDTVGIETLAADLAYEKHTKQAQAVSQLRADLGFTDVGVRNDSQAMIEVDEFEDLPNQPLKLEVAEIETTLKDAVLRKDSNYDSATINYGRDLVAIELNDLGYKNSQVKFAGDWDGGLRYVASVNTENGKIQIEVPVENVRGQILNPTQFNHENETYDLSFQSIRNASTKGSTSTDVHPLLVSMSYPDLKKQLRRAAHQHSPKLAQMVIDLIGEKFGEHYKFASIDDYQTWLEEATTSYQTRCGSCNYYTPKTATSASDQCNLIKTACKNVRKDESGVCTRSIFAEDEKSDSILFDTGVSLKF